MCKTSAMLWSAEEISQSGISHLPEMHSPGATMHYLDDRNSHNCSIVKVGKAEVNVS